MQVRKQRLSTKYTLTVTKKDLTGHASLLKEASPEVQGAKISSPH